MGLSRLCVACDLLMSIDLGAVTGWISRAISGMDVCLHANATTVSLCPSYLLMGALSHLTANAISFCFSTSESLGWAVCSLSNSTVSYLYTSTGMNQTVKHVEKGRRELRPAGCSM